MRFYSISVQTICDNESKDIKPLQEDNFSVKKTLKTGLMVFVYFLLFVAFSFFLDLIESVCMFYVLNIQSPLC